MQNLRLTSKLSLKTSCFAVCGGDIEKADRLYNYFAKDLKLPEIDPTEPSLFDKIKGTVNETLGWVRDNKDELSEAYNYIQVMRGKSSISTQPPISPELPPLPTNE